MEALIVLSAGAAGAAGLWAAKALSEHARQERAADAQAHDAEIAEVKEFMQAKNLPTHLQKKVRNYLDLLFKQAGRSKL